MTFSRLWAVLAVGLPVFAALLANLSSVDLAYHLRAGAMTLDSGSIPTRDTFTFTASGASWVNQQWGAQVLLAVTYRLAGWTGLVLLRAVLVGLLFGLLFLAFRWGGLNRRSAAWLAIGAFVVCAVALGLRPQLFGMVLFALALALVAGRRRYPAALWLVVPVVLVWANLHGSFFLGPLVTGLAGLQDRHDGVPRASRTLFVAVAAAIAACIGPFGPAVWAYAAGLSTNALITSRITEWQPTSLRSIPGILFFGSALLVVAVLARRHRAASWPDLVWLAVFFAIGAYAIRGVAWWPLAAGVVLAGLIADGGGRATIEPVERPRRANTVIVAILAIAAIVLIPAWRPLDPALGAPAGVVGNAPPGITARLRMLAVPGDRLYNPQPWGSWFEFALPGLPVAIDSRIEVFPPSVWDDYDAVSGARVDWRSILDRWGVTIVVATKDRDLPLIDQLSADAGWREAYADADGRIFVRSDRAAG
jgi:hypothetical protein